MQEYWTKEYTDLCEGVIFRIKKINPIELINLATAAIDFETATWDRRSVLITNTLRQMQWTKNNETWFPLIEEDGSPRLPELRDQPILGFDVFFAVRRDVLTPVFTESKTFQLLMPDKKE